MSTACKMVSGFDTLALHIPKPEVGLLYQAAVVGMHAAPQWHHNYTAFALCIPLYGTASLSKKLP